MLGELCMVASSRKKSLRMLTVLVSMSVVSFMAQNAGLDISIVSNGTHLNTVG